ncbi:MAG TPA: twin-arginine translocase subunit TatC [Candidatus Limnocylindrales bacterium]
MSRRSLRRRLRVPFRHRGKSPQPPAAAAEMSLAGHLVELRNRIFISVFALLPGTVLGFIFSGEIIHILIAPLPKGEYLVAFGLTEPFMIDLQVAVTVGAITAMPVILYQLWRFISPGLTDKERSTARPWVPLALVFFVLGVGVAYFILPYASGFLFTFQSQDIHLMLSAESYFGFVTILFLAFGLVMEFPIVLVLLSKVGIVTSKRLRSSRRMAVLGIVIFSAVVTPGADLVSPIVMAVVMYGLYEVSIVMIRMGGR